MTPRLLLAAAVLLHAAPAWASGVPSRASGALARASTPPADPNGCLAAIQAAEGALHLPPGLLGAIAMVESGRLDPRTGRPAPWPWTINVAGAGFFFQTKEEAIAAVEAARATGVRSIDVGCMQVNLMYHSDAFDRAAWVRMGLVPAALPVAPKVTHTATAAPRSHIRLASLARLGSVSN